MRLITTCNGMEMSIDDLMDCIRGQCEMQRDQ